MGQASKLSHPEMEKVLEYVKEQKLKGLTVLSICHQLQRNFKPPATRNMINKPVWQTNHVLAILKELRRREELPEAGLLLQVKAIRDGNRVLNEVAV